jgi:hypothetical protein
MIVIVVFAAGAYFYYQGQATPADDALTIDNTEVVVGANVLSLLNQIQSLKIDTSIFKSPVYQSLIDYSIPIPTLPVGRSDPFAPIPGFVEQSAPIKR